MTHPLSIEQVTARELAPPEFVSLAASLGCVAVGMFVQSAGEGAMAAPLIEDAALRRETRARLDDTGLRFEAAACFVLAPDIEVTDYEAALDTSAYLGARTATTIIFDPEPARRVESFGRLAELAGARGIILNVEFLAFSPVRNLAAARQLVQAAGRGNTGVLVDILHLTRSGGTPAELADFDPALIGGAQICDGPETMPPELQMAHEGLFQRMLPGEGSFPLQDFVRALPDGQLISVEVPLKSHAGRGVPVEQRARLAVEATRRVLADIALTGQEAGG